jgi:hypothetical protein
MKMKCPICGNEVITATLTEEDKLNVKKWLTATSMMIEAKLRTPYSQSELDTAEKLTK